jgi:hypothetical protein
LGSNFIFSSFSLLTDLLLREQCDTERLPEGQPGLQRLGDE